uniref:HepT-like ribonuclease domain-containing protein n=1 Tax=Fulvivirga sp. TaxID=1931237 RepID=UPI00404969CF
MKVNSVYIAHITEAIDSIFEYTSGLNEQRFLKSKLVQDAVIRKLQIIGEATKKITEPLREEYDNIPWKQMAGMRDKLIHDYMGVDLWAVWAVVEIELPKIKPLLDKIQEELEGE